MKKGKRGKKKHPEKHKSHVKGQFLKFVSPRRRASRVTASKRERQPDHRLEPKEDPNRVERGAIVVRKSRIRKLTGPMTRPAGKQPAGWKSRQSGTKMTILRKIRKKLEKTVGQARNQ